jgi:hypothetical protein
VNTTDLQAAVDHAAHQIAQALTTPLAALAAQRDELATIVRDLVDLLGDTRLGDPDAARGPRHDGPCVNADGDPPDPYATNPLDMCVRCPEEGAAWRARTQALVTRARQWLDAHPETKEAP